MTTNSIQLMDPRQVRNFRQIIAMPYHLQLSNSSGGGLTIDGDNLDEMRAKAVEETTRPGGYAHAALHIDGAPIEYFRRG